MNWTEIVNVAFFTTLSASALRFATPILFSALGETFVERSGILNVAVEGVMLGSALVGFLAMQATGDVVLTVCLCILAGATMGLMLGVFYITLQANQIVTGILVNSLVFGASGYAYDLLFGSEVLPTLSTIRTIPIPVLSEIPLLGALFDQSLMTYAALLLVPVASLLLYRTHFGLQVRSVGERPRAADTLGVQVYFTRYMAMVIGGGAAGAGGAFYAVHFGTFIDTIIAGRGFIALAIVIFGRWNPWRVLFGAFLFGFVDALQLRLQALDVPVPHQFLLMLPYLLTILVLVISRRSRSDVGGPSGPMALATPYER